MRRCGCGNPEWTRRSQIEHGSLAEAGILQRGCRNDIFDESGVELSDRSGGQNFDYARVVTNESWKHRTDASTSGRIGRIGCDYISVNNSWSEIYHGSWTKEQDRTSGVAWKPKKIHAKPGETGVESCQRWL